MVKTRSILLVLAAVISLDTLRAQEKPAEKKDQPKILMALPLAVSPGAMAKVTLRGLKLDQAGMVTISGLEMSPNVELKKKEKISVPNGLNANEVGDTQVEIEFSLPETIDAKELQLTVTTPDGASQPYNLMILTNDKLIPEREPNEGFRNGLTISPGQTIAGSIHQQRDVDVFQLQGKAGQTINAETLSARRGSALDPILSLYDEAGQLLASSDDEADHRDAVLKYKFPHAGKFYLALIDAHDRGSAAHPYLLQLRSE